MTESLPKTPQESPRLDPRLLGLVLALGLVFGLGRLFYAATQPLWFDESFTLAVISPPDFASFWREVYLDSNAPGYYLLARIWTDICGRSDLALRIPGLVAVAVAAALPLLYRPPGLSRNAALTWGGVMFIWWGVGVYLDGRCYPVLLASSTFQVLAYIRLLQRPSRSTAWIWAITASISVLLHYYAGFVVLAQGLIYLASARKAALKTWPAALAFLPAAGWIAHHAPRLAAYSQPSVAWHPRLTATTAIDQLVNLITNGPTVGIICIAVLLAISLVLGKKDRAEPFGDRAITLAILAGVAGLGLIIATGLLKPTLTGRYLIPAVPTVLLAIVMAVREGRWRTPIYGGLILAYAVLQAPHALERLHRTPNQPSYEYETVSNRLADQGVTDLIYVWDHELAPMMDTGTMKRVGGVFFTRRNQPVDVTHLVVDRDHNPNLAILAAAKGKRPGVIWLFNREGHTASALYAPNIAARDPAWTCITSGDGVIGSVGCYRRP